MSSSHHSRNALVATVASIALFAAAPAHAVPISPSPTILSGDLTFYNFTAHINGTTGTTPTQNTQIGVSPIGTIGIPGPGIRFNAAFSASANSPPSFWPSTDTSSIDIILTYSVSAPTQEIEDISMDFNGALFGVDKNSSAAATVTESVYTSDPTLGGTLVKQISVNAIGPEQLVDIPLGANYTSLYVVKDILLNASAKYDFWTNLWNSDQSGATISFIDQQFSEATPVPEPASLGLLGLGLLGMGLLYCRRTITV